MSISFLLLGVSLASGVQPPPAALQAKATGRFVLAEAPAAYEPRLEAAVESGMESLPFFIKPLARLRLRPAVFVTICPEVSLVLDGETFSASCGGEQAPFTRRLDGSDGPLIDDGDPYQVQVTVTATSVGLRFTGEKGGQANTYVFEPDGSMVVHSTLFSPYLPDALIWSLRYRRGD